MPLRGFSPPFTPRVLAALVRPPPWHYAGWLLTAAPSWCDSPASFPPL
jgi:hypothetical protein